MLVIISQQEGERLRKLVESQQQLIETQGKLLESYSSDEVAFRSVIRLQDEVIALLKEGRTAQNEAASALLAMMAAKARVK